MRVLVLSLALAFTMLAARSDKEIESDLTARISRSKINNPTLRAQVKNGVAILSGKVEIPQHKGTATRMAKSAGATTVDNRIEVSAAGKAKAAEKLAHARTVARSAPRAPARSEPVTEPRSGGPAPPPVRRAVVKR